MINIPYCLKLQLISYKRLVLFSGRGNQHCNKTTPGLELMPGTLLVHNNNYIYMVLLSLSFPPSPNNMRCLTADDRAPLCNIIPCDLFQQNAANYLRIIYHCHILQIRVTIYTRLAFITWSSESKFWAMKSVAAGDTCAADPADIVHHEMNNAVSSLHYYKSA